VNKQLELFPELNWKEYKYQGKTYRRYNGGDTPYRKKVESQMKLQRFIDEYKKII